MTHRTHIQIRMMKHADSKPVTALERSRKLKSLHVTQGKLSTWRNTCKKIINNTKEDLQTCEQQLAIIDAEINKLEKSNDKTIVTEHALLRYVERMMNVDLEKCHAEILKLSDKEVVKSGNTIITCYTGPDDHFNLAERESI